MNIKEKLQLQADVEAANTKRYEDWKKGREAMNGMVQIREETLQKVFCLLNQKRVKYLSKASNARNPELANKYKAKARGYDVLLDEIAAALDPKE